MLVCFNIVFNNNALNLYDVIEIDVNSQKTLFLTRVPTGTKQCFGDKNPLLADFNGSCTAFLQAAFASGKLAKGLQHNLRPFTCARVCCKDVVQCRLIYTT